MKNNQKTSRWFDAIDKVIQTTKYPNSMSGGLNFYREWNKKFYQHDIRITSTVCNKKLIKDTIRELFIKKYNNKFFKNYEILRITEDRSMNKLLVMGKSLRCMECNSKKISKNEIINDVSRGNNTYIINLWCQPCWKYKQQLDKLTE